MRMPSAQNVPVYPFAGAFCVFGFPVFIVLFPEHQRNEANVQITCIFRSKMRIKKEHALCVPFAGATRRRKLTKKRRQALFEYFFGASIHDRFCLPDGQIVRFRKLLKRQSVNIPVTEDSPIADAVDPVENAPKDFKVRIIVLVHLTLILPVPPHILHLR